MSTQTKFILTLTLLLSVLRITGCAHSAEPISKTGFYFDTVIQVTVYDSSDAACLDGCLNLADFYERMFSTTIEGSDIWNINHSGGKPVTVSDETVELLQISLDYAALSDGLVDPTVLPLSELWNFGSDKTPRVPSEAEIQAALAHVGYHAVAIEGNSVTLLDAHAAIDLGFIAKGYIADRMKEYLLNNHVRSACINLGGNVLAIGAKPDGSPFRIGVQEPFAAKGQTATVVPVTDRSLVSSGVYERYFYENDTLYHHILNTKTGYPIDNELTGVTILSDSSVTGDALSTTCYCLGLKDGVALIESLDGVEALFITQDGELIRTSGFPAEP